jgi:hypothetical protein
VDTVNQSSLTGVPQGPELGILGLPQDLPGAGLLVKQPWSVCTQTLNDVPKVGQETTTTVSGGIQTGGQQLGGDALLVKTSGQNGQDWVIWDNERLSISTSTLLAEFEQQPVSVPTVWLNAIPQGPGFRESLPQGPKTFVNGPAGQQVEVGQLYTVNNAGSTQYYEVLQDGRLRPLTQLEASLLGIAGAPAQQSLAASDLNNGHVEGTLSTDGLPATKPQVSGATPLAPFCAVYSGSGSTPQVQTGGQMPSQGTPTGAPVNSGQIDSVALPDGKAALVQEPGDNISYFLVTGGRRYPMASNEVPVFLGYSLSDAVRVPASVMDLIPSGPAFNPSQANDLVPPQPVGTGPAG